MYVYTNVYYFISSHNNYATVANYERNDSRMIEEWNHYGEKAGQPAKPSTAGKEAKTIRENFSPESTEQLFRGKENHTSRGGDTSQGIILDSGLHLPTQNIVKVIHIPESITVYQVDDASFFRESLRLAQKTSAHGAKVALRDIEEYKDCKLFIAEKGATGIAVAPDGHIFSLFKNSKVCQEKNISHVAAKMMFIALSNGGKKLDCFDGFLPNLYTTFGFEAVTKIKFYPELTAGVPWNYDRDGRPDLIFMKHNGESVDKIINNMGFYKKYDSSRVPYSPDIHTAEKRLDEAIVKSHSKKNNIFILSR